MEVEEKEARQNSVKEIRKEKILKDEKEDSINGAMTVGGKPKIFGSKSEISWVLRNPVEPTFFKSCELQYV